MSTLLIDCETFSEEDVTKVGSYKYACHPSTRVLLWSIRDPEWERSLVFEEPDLWHLLGQLKDANTIQWTRNEPLDLIHWSPFDLQIVQETRTFWPHVWDESPDTLGIIGPTNTFWHDLSSVSLAYGGPTKLKHAATFFAGDESKDEGKHLISRFCAPQKDGTIHDKESDPVRWEQFRTYAAQDTNVMVPLLERFADLAANGGEDMLKHWPALRCIGRMNERGVPIDLESARLAQAKLHTAAERAAVACEREYGFKPTAVAKVKDYIGTDNCQKETLEDFIENNQGTAEQRTLAKIRLLTSGAAAKKLTPMLRREVEGRVHGCFMYHGAWTRRLTSSGVQFQNMLRSASDAAFFQRLHFAERLHNIFEEVRRNIRGFVQAPPGLTFVAADYSQVELRVGAWLAGEVWLTELMRNGGDPYLVMASEIYGERIDDKKDPRRQFGKIVELAAIFGLGWHGLQIQAAARGIELTEAAAKRTIQAFRRLHPAIVQCWDACQKAFELCMGAEVGAEVSVGLLTFIKLELAIKVVRPSGFAQYFWSPHYIDGEWPDGGHREEIAYYGRGKGGMMILKTTYGGDIFQGGVQGTAADLMCEGLIKAEAAGFEPVMSIHDEGVFEIIDDGTDHIDEVCKLISQLPHWAKGLPLVAEGWQQRRFTK